MELLSNKKICTVALLLLLAISGIVAFLPSATAHTPPYNIPTYAYTLVSPNPVGVNQQAIVLMWIDKTEPSAAGIGGGRWQGFTLTITAPDGTVQKMGPYTADPTSTTNALWTPTEVGKYTLVFNFPGGIASITNPINGINGTASPYNGDYYMPSNATTIVTVQAQTVQAPAPAPLPTGYWTRPVESELTSWAPLLSNWLNTPPLMTQNVQPFGGAPGSAHIMWANPVQFGGVVGGSYGSGATKFGSVAPSGYTFYEGMSYEERNISPIIMGGYLYYELPLSDQATGGGYVAVDLRTGQQLWKQNYAVNPTFGQLYGYDTINQHGVIPNGYLWAVSGSTWIAYDGMTGNWLFNLTFVPSGTTRYGQNGEILRYVLDPNGKWLAEWNNTNSQGELATANTTGANGLEWRTVGKVIDSRDAYSWNVTFPTPLAAGSTIIDAIPGYMLLTNTPMYQYNTLPQWGTNPYTITAISLNPATAGQVLWTKSYSPPAGNVTRIYDQMDPSTNVFTMYDKETFQYWGFSLTNGNQVWGPFTAPDQTGLQYFQWSPVNNGVLYNGVLYATGWGGVVSAADDTNGKLLWTYGDGGVGNSTSMGVIGPWGNYPTFIGAVVGGKVIVYNSEHSPIEPPYVDEQIRCLDAATGTQQWTLNAWPVSTTFYTYLGAIADGYLTYFNEYDGRMYSVGKGPSATTVEAPMSGVTAGSVITIKGTVTDQSPGTKDTPAISDKDMTAWMLYMYLQFQMPSNATGVPVQITAVAQDGTVTNIGTAVSDIGGSFGIAWTPTTAGTYEIIANFAGTNSYGNSYATTYVAVGKAAATAASPAPTATATPMPTATLPPTSPSAAATPSPSSAPPPTQPPFNETYLVVVAAAVVVIVVAAAAVVLKRRK